MEDRELPIIIKSLAHAHTAQFDSGPLGAQRRSQ